MPVLPFSVCLFEKQEADDHTDKDADGAEEVGKQVGECAKNTVTREATWEALNGLCEPASDHRPNDRSVARSVHPVPFIPWVISHFYAPYAPYQRHHRICFGCIYSVSTSPHESVPRKQPTLMCFDRDQFRDSSLQNSDISVSVSLGALRTACLGGLTRSKSHRVLEHRGQPKDSAQSQT